MDRAWVLLLGAALVAGAVWAHEDQKPRYEISAASADGQTAWRLDRKTGNVSVCGTMLPGQALSQALAQNEATLLTMAANPPQDRGASYLRDSENLRLITTPRCSGWSASTFSSEQ